MLDLNWDLLINGGSGLAVIYLATKIEGLTALLKTVLADVADLKVRVTRLEKQRDRDAE